MSTFSSSSVSGGATTNPSTTTTATVPEEPQTTYKQRYRTRQTFILIYSIILILLAVFVIYYVASPHVDTRKYFEYVRQLNVNVANESIKNLTNANAIGNLPNVHIVTNNQEINDRSRCRNGAVFLAPRLLNDTTDYTTPCINTCGSEGRVITIGPTDEVAVNHTLLTEGVWCVTTPAIECNLATHYLHMSVTGHACRTKYPNMFGNNNQIVGCHNEMFPVTNSDLMDWSTGRPINLQSLTMTHEDEVLNDQIEKRFSCRFGEDFMGNAYLPHPLNRFHPIRNPCNYSIYRSSTDIKPVIDEANGTWHCDCGDFNTTRVKRLDPNNPKSTCSTCISDSTPLDTNLIGGPGLIPYTSAVVQKAPYICFTVNSQYTDAPQMDPCGATLFINNGNRCGTLTFNVAHHPTDIQPMPFSYVVPDNQIMVVDTTEVLLNDQFNFDDTDVPA